MRLKKYTVEDFDLLRSWVTDAELLFQFAGTAWTFPLTQSQIFEYQKQYPERQFYMAFDSEEKAFAFGEIIVNDINTPRLGRLLVGEKNNRGKGLGGKFVDLLIQECKQRLNPDIIYLYVFEDNHPAISCYEKSGFVLDKENKIIFPHENTEHVALIMRYNVNS
ncbi:Protein N-acetyltransferase, RimJ/RimL family [Dyadobacter koreensis]|uniref:Protein N-acetyltransferase, RimJ/RimL family n=1 Tax=Dyadobacter koreensis TaxID=408657 RepID=A0A1H6V9S1_9BACT|nr:GNAT family protein [Dyadobacter koreensis]SEI97410.1 Protein N-acetyltransferase, RimJ/RimL family [Dyadobacter koreensis]